MVVQGAGRGEAPCSETRTQVRSKSRRCRIYLRLSDFRPEEELIQKTVAGAELDERFRAVFDKVTVHDLMTRGQ